MNALHAALLVGSGGFLGSLLRFWAGLAAARLAPQSALPLATLGVNLIGCFGLGLCLGLLEASAAGGRHEALRLFLAVGLLGGFTTFSTFGVETLGLWRSAGPGLVLANLGLQVGGGLLAAAAGFACAARVCGAPG